MAGTKRPFSDESIVFANSLYPYKRSSQEGAVGPTQPAILA